jgi:uracil-DNA glycosylase
MVLGHDFHNAAGYVRSFVRGQESLNSPTWRVLIKLLSEAGLPLSQCFFTNFFMGLRQGKAVTGPFPGTRDLEFVSRCQLFLLHQLALQKPRLVLVLGNEVPARLSPLARALEPWAKYQGFHARDSANVALIERAQFYVIQPFPCHVISLVHPSMRHANIGQRKWHSSQGQDYSGNDAEVEMIKYAWSIGSQ